MPIKKTTPEDIEDFIKAAERARKIKPSQEDIDKINELLKELEIEEQQKEKKQALKSNQI